MSDKPTRATPRRDSADKTATSGSPPARSVSRQVIEYSESFRGPLPPPQTLTQYNTAFPDAAERIMRMAEAQAAHRQTLEKARIHADIANEKLGQWLAFVLAVLIFAGGFLLVWQGKDIAGITLLLTEILALAGLFIYGRESRRRDLERRRQDLLESASADDAA